ncbi:MAG: hypothetical protein ACLPUO_17300 [Streptosporangiaceae bacterium]|jgi:hypothetical protein
MRGHDLPGEHRPADEPPGRPDPLQARLAELRQRLERLPPGHPSAADQSDEADDWPPVPVLGDQRIADLPPDDWRPVPAEPVDRGLTGQVRGDQPLPGDWAPANAPGGAGPDGAQPDTDGAGDGRPADGLAGASGWPADGLAGADGLPDTDGSGDAEPETGPSRGDTQTAEPQRSGGRRPWDWGGFDPSGGLLDFLGSLPASGPPGGRGARSPYQPWFAGAEWARPWFTGEF